MNPTLQNILTATANASVIHVSCGSPLSIRVAGHLRFLEEFGVISPPAMQGFLEELLTAEERSKLIEQKGLLCGKKLSRDLRYRIHVVFEKGLPAVTLHAFPVRIEPFETLGLPKRTRGLLLIEQGLILVSGPAGSGKTSVIASLCESWNRETAKRILLIGRPIEFTLESKKSHIEYIEVGSDAATVTAALENAQSEDYDVVYVSDYSEPGVLERVFSLMAAGTCVILEIQSQTTAGALDQLIMTANRHSLSFPEYQCADRFSGSLSVRLIPAAHTPLALAAEMALAMPEIKVLIRAKKFDALLRFLETSKGEMVISLDESIALLVDRNVVSFEHALSFVRNPARFQRLVQGISLEPSLPS